MKNAGDTVTPRLNDWRDCTNATTPRHLWMDAVFSVASVDGMLFDAAWIGEPEQRARLNRYYSAGEPVWMAADAMLQFHRGYQQALREKADGLSLLRAARELSNCGGLADTCEGCADCR